MIRDAARSAFHPSFRRPSLLARLLCWDAAHRQRHRLARLDDAALRDMGLTRAEAEYEARRAAWGAPNHWSQR